jgi:hypothetical protein
MFALGRIHLVRDDQAERHADALVERRNRVGLAPFVHLVALGRHHQQPRMRNPHEPPA